MCKKEFLDKLSKELAHLSKSEREERLAFYSEMIDDHDMNGEEKGTAKHQQITGTHRKAFLYTKQIEKQ